MGCLRFIQRTWKRFLNADFQNLAEHHLRVIWIALILAKHEGVEDTGKVIKMALVHDIPESRAGDVDYLSRQYVERNEALGLEDMLDGTALQEEFIALWHEYEKRECIEAKIVKDADNLDVDFELQEEAARGNIRIGQKKEEARHYVFENKLYTETAKKMWQQMKEVDPHDFWYNSDRNRLNSGDWKSTK
ncbi:hypothetical protein CYG49_00845 [Candidatus Saccharibacteria bacterium]|nr:MAG: hypothetical protein CYG49_00845 [Candidatus Saccharibacteria bacterium]